MRHGARNAPQYFYSYSTYNFLAIRVDCRWCLSLPELRCRISERCEAISKETDDLAREIGGQEERSVP
jgi:hypothetical protein